MVGVSRKSNLKWDFEGGLKIPNFICRQSRNFGPYLGNHISMIRSLIIMTNYLLVVLLANNKFDNYQKKLCEDVPLRGAQKPKNVTCCKNRHLLTLSSYWQRVNTISSIIIFPGTVLTSSHFLFTNYNGGRNAMGTYNIFDV